MEDFQIKGSAFDINSDKRAVELFKEKPELSLQGDKRVSIEADPFYDESDAFFKLAVDDPTKFLELVGYLPHLIQDIFFQYYLLGRTQVQIAKVLGCSQTNIWQDLRLGREAIGAILEFGGPPPTAAMDAVKANGRQFKMACAAYRAMAAFKTKEHQREPLTIKEPKTLGEFQLSIDDETFDLNFSPATTDGPVRSPYTHI